MYHFLSRRGGTKELIPFWTDDKEVSRTFGERNSMVDFAFTAAPIIGGELTIKTNQKVDHGYGRDQVLMYYHGATFIGPWRLDTNKHYVITPNDGKLSFVSVEDAIYQLDTRMLGHAPDVTAEEASDSVTGRILEYAGALLSGLAWGMSGAVPITGLALYPLGTLIGVAFSSPATTAPAPPSLSDIEGAVRGVITETLDAATAARAGQLFGQNVKWFFDTGKVVASYSTGNDSPPAALIDSFRETVRNALNQTNSHSFISTLEYVASDTDISKRILCEYVAGVGLALHLKRIALAITYLPDHLAPGTAAPKIPTAELEGLLQFAKDHRVALRAAMDAFVQHRRELVAATGLQGTPEAVYALRHVTTHFTDQPDAVPDEQYRGSFPNGSDYLPDGTGYGSGADGVTKSLGTLDEIIGFLDEDVKAGNLNEWPNHLFTLQKTA